MAFSINEKLLAEKLIGKISYPDPHICDFYEIVDINEGGMVRLRKNKAISVYERGESYYPELLKRTTLDDRLDEFKQGGKFFLKKYASTVYYQLFTNGEYSFALDMEDGKLAIVPNNYIAQYIPPQEVEQVLLSEEALDKIDKYQDSIETMYQDFKSEFASKSDILEAVRNSHAKLKSQIDYKENEDKVKDSKTKQGRKFL